MPNASATTDIPNILLTSGTLDPDRTITELRLGNGEVLRLPTAFLREAELRTHVDTTSSDSIADTSAAERISVVEERLLLGKQVVPTATVRLHKTVESYTTQLDEPLAIRTYDIERTVLNQVVEAAPGIRTEGDTTVYPVVEEQAIVTKQLVLKEEIRVTRRDTERRDEQTVTLRREHVEVEREPVTTPATL